MPFASIARRVSDSGWQSLASLDRKRKSYPDGFERLSHGDLAIHHPNKVASFKHRDDFDGDPRSPGQFLLRPVQKSTRLATLFGPHLGSPSFQKIAREILKNAAMPRTNRARRSSGPSSTEIARLVGLSRPLSAPI
jgi:hypothetical protein